MPKFVHVLIKFIVPVLVVAFAFRTHKLLGAAAAAVYLAVMFYRGRTGFFAFLGNQSYKNGNLQEALMWMNKAASRKDCRAAYLIGYSYLLLKTGHTDQAAEILQRVYRLPLTREEKMNADSNYALLLWRQGKLEEATAKLEEVYAEYKNTNVYSSLGYFYIAKGDLDKALAFNREAYEYNDTSPVIIDNLGQTLYLRGELEEALALYEKLHAMNPTFPEAYYNYALALESAGRREQALKIMRDALNQPISVLNTVTKEEIEAKIAELSAAAQ